MGDQVVSSAKTGVTFTPDLTPVLDLSEDDLLEDDNNDPIQITRNPQVDAYNQVQLEYLDRYADYNTTIDVVNNQAAQDVYGLRPDVTMAHAIADPTVAWRWPPISCNIASMPGTPTGSSWASSPIF